MFVKQICNKIDLGIFLYYYIVCSEVEMDFFRRNKKVIVGFIFVAVALWLLGGTAIIALLSMGR